VVLDHRANDGRGPRFAALPARGLEHDEAGGKQPGRAPTRAYRRFDEGIDGLKEGLFEGSSAEPCRGGIGIGICGWLPVFRR